MLQRITSRQNEYIRHLRLLAADSKYRYSSGEFVCDGGKLLEEALKAGAEITSALFRDGDASDLGCPAYTAPDDLFEYASTMKNSPGPVFTVKMREMPQSYSNAIVLENVQDPGNVGTVIRTANAFSIGAVFLVGDCADLYSPKTVRATMGGIFRQTVITGGFPDIPVYAAVLADDASEIGSIALKNCAVAVGSEGKGLTDELIARCERKIIIPMNRESESLNAAVAASVFMWEMSKC